MIICHLFTTIWGRNHSSLSQIRGVWSGLLMNPLQNVYFFRGHKTNMEPSKNWCFVGLFPFSKRELSGSMLVFLFFFYRVVCVAYTLKSKWFPGTPQHLLHSTDSPYSPWKPERLRLTTFLALKPDAKLIVQPVIVGPVAILDLFKYKI